MKKICWLALLLCFCGGVYAWRSGMNFNAEKILQGSLLGERTFRGEAKEISVLNGKVKAFFMEEHSVPLVAISFGFSHAGRAYEPKDGVSLLAENTLLDGAGAYSRYKLRELMKEKGIKIVVSAEDDTLDFSLSYVKKFVGDAKDVIKAVLYEPKLAEEDLDLARRQLEAVRQQQAENPQYHLGRLVEQKFYGSHPYGKDDIPQSKMLAKLSASDIRSYLKQAMGANNLSVGVSGDITEAEAKAILEDIFAPLTDNKGGFEMPLFEPNLTAEPEMTDIDFSAQSFVLILGLGVKRLDKDFYPLYVADYVLGGSGLTSRLNKAVREKEGLTYGIYSYLSNSDAFDGWYITFSATSDKIEKALSIVKNVYADFYQNGLSKEEFEQAKKSMLSSFNLRFSSLFNVAEMLKEMQRQNLGIDFLQKRQGYIKELTLEQVNDTIRRRMPAQLDFNNKVRLFKVNGKRK